MIARVSDDSQGLRVLVPTASVAALLIAVQNEFQEALTSLSSVHGSSDPNVSWTTVLYFH